MGLWQFLPEGARIYGLRVDYWVDERKDPVRSTEAAARYLGDLKARFGSWHLALAAFNAGYGAVLRAMQKYNTNDYWELCRHEDGLPWETLLYVPKAIATALVGENRGLLRLRRPVSRTRRSRFDGVPVQASVQPGRGGPGDGRARSRSCSGSTRELRRGRTPPLATGATWALRAAQGLRRALPRRATDAEGERLDPYVVRFGERLEDIAKARGTSVARAAPAQRRRGQHRGRAGLTLVVPPLPPAAAARARRAACDEMVIVAVPDKRLVVPGRSGSFTGSSPATRSRRSRASSR